MYVSVLNNDTDALNLNIIEYILFSLQVYTSVITEDMNVKTYSVIQVNYSVYCMYT